MSENISRRRVQLLQRRAQRRSGLHTEVMADLQTQFALVRYVDKRDAHGDFSDMILEDLPDALHSALGHARIWHLERDLFHFLVADAVKRHDLQRVELGRDRRLVEG